MSIKKGFYYLGWGWGTDENIEPGMGEFKTYDEALKAAIESHKDELDYQKRECGARRGDDVQNTLVFYCDPDDGCYYVMAAIGGWRCEIEEYEYE